MNTKRTLHFLFCLTLFASSASCVSRTQFDAAVASRTNTEQDLKVVRSDLHDAQSDVDDLGNQRDELDVLLESANIRAREAETQLEKRTQTVKSLQAELKATRADTVSAIDEELAMTAKIATALVALQQELTAIHSQARAIEDANSVLKTELSVTTDARNQAQTALSEARSSNDILKGENGRLNESLNQVRLNIESASQVHSNTSQELKKSKAAHAETQANYQKSQAEVTKLQKKVKRAQKKLEAAGQAETLLKHQKEQLLADNELLAKTSRDNAKLMKDLNKEIGSSRVKIRELSGRVQVDLPSAILFPSGAKELGRRGKKALGELAQVFANIKDRVIRVYGHTDNIPVNAGASYVDNLGLSAMRASRVVSYLLSEGVDPSIIAPVGLGEHFPVGDNTTKSGRSQNRRIEIVLIPKLAAQVEDKP